MQEKCLNLLVREDLDQLLKHLEMEKEIRKMEEIPLSNIADLSKQGANAVIFGAIDDDIEGGEVNIKVILQAFNHVLLAEKQVQIQPHQRHDGKVRREKMKCLAEQLCEFINTNFQTIKEKLMEPTIQEKCKVIASDILSQTRLYRRLILKEKNAEPQKMEINLAIISALEGLTESYISIQKCPDQPESFRKKSKQILSKYNEEILKRKIGAKADPLYRNIKKILKDNENKKEVEDLGNIIEALKNLEIIYSDYPKLFPSTLKKIRSDIDRYNEELINFLKEGK